MGWFLCVQAPFPGQGEGRRNMAHMSVWLCGFRFGTRITIRDSSLDQRVTEMLKSIKSRGEEAFAKFLRRKEKKARKKMQKARQETAEHVARLRARRLAKEAVEAADKKAAEEAAAEKAAAKNKEPSHLPQAHRTVH